jgi:hypothetical protein
MLQESPDVCSRFCEVADQFCAVVDSAPSVSRDELVLKIYPPPNDILWKWRLGFYSHWGKHAIDALRTIHFLLENTLS